MMMPVKPSPARAFDRRTSSSEATPPEAITSNPLLRASLAEAAALTPVNTPAPGAAQSPRRYLRYCGGNGYERTGKLGRAAATAAAGG